jgi:hypothetical protein
VASLAWPAVVAATLAGLGGIPASAATRCWSDEIVTDRPDVTNSSIVVPAGSLQSENGIDFAARDASRVLDGANSRLRFGIAPCAELLVDLPSYFLPTQGRASAGFSNIVPAVKWQLGPLPGKIDLSLTAGAGLPTGTRRRVWRQRDGDPFFFPETSRSGREQPGSGAAARKCPRLVLLPLQLRKSKMGRLRRIAGLA